MVVSAYLIVFLFSVSKFSYADEKQPVTCSFKLYNILKKITEVESKIEKWENERESFQESVLSVLEHRRNEMKQFRDEITNKTKQLSEYHVNYCIYNPCVHGTCVNGAMNYTCVCPVGVSGDQCETVLASDCFDIKHMNIGSSTGVYKIHLWKTHENLDVLCDMDTDGGGWTVFQNRFNGSVDFYRNFANYTSGFGTFNGEFWLGLKYIHELASHALSELRIDVTDANDTKLYETFQNFSISAGPKYTLHVLPGRGTLGDGHLGLSRNNDMHFSTMDRDMDTNSANCAQIYRGGWWYKSCVVVNLNGKYYTPGTINPASMNYRQYKNTYASLKTSKMMFRRV